ncbi:fatty acid desaturase [Hymenobacter sp. RP-2-7]|uniref:Fatty acid desaturase n=1 Tax=Hymenobacter polaris TaxID=2682546 RepID=A0A7Y0FKX9_9BACT|nr:fatty acid desaturase [Hymenobacter polaris]NML64227.1 fatty acid desaturase [Hymenobacter polaris]
MATAPLNYTPTAEPITHHVRARQILKSHPEVKRLMGRNAMTAVITAACVAAQVLVAWLLRGQAWYWSVLAAYAFGAFVCHTLFVIIHEATHNLVFKGQWANASVGIAANLPMVIPSAMSFRKFHLKHHSALGHFEHDADLPDHYEAELIRHYALGKMVWLFFFPVFQLVRTFRCKSVVPFDKYIAVNWLAQLAFNVAIWLWLGPVGFLYLFASFWFSVSLHPVGARWIQEHYLVLNEEQETTSYYGRLNGVHLNIGYHNEHHDLPGVPWNKLPELRKLAPEYYDTLEHHTSYTKVLLRFLFDQEISLYSRLVRGDFSKKKDRPRPVETVAAGE